MNKLFENFSKPSKKEWEEQLTKELKGKDFDSNLQKYDEIEGLTLASYLHEEDFTSKNLTQEFTNKRAFVPELNDWTIVGEIQVLEAKSANAKALEILMKGCTGLHFEFQNNRINLSELFKDIEFQYINCILSTLNLEQYKELEHYFENLNCPNLFLNLQSSVRHNAIEINNILPKKGQTNVRKIEVNAFEMQQAGANCSQELAFALSLGNEFIGLQLSEGLDVDAAFQNIHFTFGIGSNYLHEIAKLRAFRSLWTKIASEYGASEKAIKTVQITSKTGFLNKSLQDPHTNLLRQTTEVMSAVIGGANHIINQAFDKLSQSGTSENAERLALNISLILKEESYLDKVLDAAGGSYAIEKLTEMLVEKAWTLFQEAEEEGGVFKCSLPEKIRQTAKKRIEFLNNNKKTLIGVNKFKNEQGSELEWKPTETGFLGLKPLILENELINS